LELLTPSRADELLADLHARTQLPVERYEIGNVDLLRDTADLVVYYAHSRPDRRVVVPFEPTGVRTRTGQGTIA